MNAIRSSTLTCVLALLLASSAAADGLNPGSLLLFPEFDHTQGHDTLITLTNTNLDAALGNVRVHFEYVNGNEGPTQCFRADRTEFLTPGDTLTLLTSVHNPGNFNRGYLYVFAVDAQGEAVSFNYIVGDVIQVDGAHTLQYAVNPLPFVAITGQGNTTDADADGIRDLDGTEYEQAPARIKIPRFMGQNNEYQSSLVLVALSGGRQFTSLLDFLIYNDNEEVFSAQYSFRCWEKTQLLSISAAFANDFLHIYTTNASGEIVGYTSQEAGWISIDGNLATSVNTTIPDPAFLAVLVEHGGGLNKFGAELPFFDGRQDNGKLLPVSNEGDGN